MSCILYLSINDWYGMKQRPRHFAELLSVNNFVLYFCQKTWKSEAYTGYSENEKKSKIVYYNKNLTVIRKKFIPFNRFKLINIINIIIKKFVVLHLIKNNKPDIIWLTLPEQYKYIPSKFNGCIVYDCMDDHARFNNDDRIDYYEQQLVSKAHCIIVSSEKLKNKINNYNMNKTVAIIKNGVEFERFYNYYVNNSVRTKPLEFKDNKKIIGYIGTIDYWFDVKLVEYIAKNNPQLDFVLVGPNNNKYCNKLKKMDNVIFTGFKKYEELSIYLYYFDVCIMPFVLNALIESVNPVKLYEYLSMGKPVVLTKYAEIIEFEKYVYFASNKNEFLIQLQNALHENNQELINQRIIFAKHNSWNARIEKVNELLKILNNQDDISVYN